MNMFNRFMLLLTDTAAKTDANGLDTVTKICDNIQVQKILGLVHTVYLILLIAVPTLVLIMSIISFIKALMAGKEDEIKNAQNKLVKSIIAMVIVLLIQLFVTVVISVLSDQLNKKTEGNELIECINIVVSGKKKTIIG